MAMDDTRSIAAIDVHGHYGDYNSPVPPLNARCMSGDAATVAQRARQANIEWTVVSPLLGLFPRGKADTVAGNDEAAKVVPATDGLLQWVIVNPLQPKTYAQAERMLSHPRCVGIKIHPEEHRYPIREHGREIFEFAARYRAVVLTHSGEANSLPDDFVPFINDFPEVNLILAHIGCSSTADRDLQVRAIQKSRHGNLFADTSSANSILPGLIEWAVQEVGAERVLFGTDTPLYSTAMQRTRIDSAELTESQRRLILRDNARRLLRIPVDGRSTAGC